MKTAWRSWRRRRLMMIAKTQVCQRLCVTHVEVNELTRVGRYRRRWQTRRGRHGARIRSVRDSCASYLTTQVLQHFCAVVVVVELCVDEVGQTLQVMILEPHTHTFIV